MKPLFTALLFCSLLCPLIRASEVMALSADLGYLRVHSIVQERGTIQEALQQSRALVLDLRRPLDERDAGETLHQELASHPAKSRLYVLVSPATPVPVVGAIAANSARLVTLGIKGSQPEPQVVVQQSAEDDRKAYDALTAGSTLADLVSGKIEKERYDEASLVQEFKNGNHDARPPAVPALRSPESEGGSPAEGSEATQTKGNGSPVRPTDRVLQRAMHLHRALLALKR